VLRTCRREAIRLVKRIAALDAELADNRQALDSAVNAQIRTQITDRTIGTAFRDGWQGDYPSMMEFVEPLFVTGAGSNHVD
jgi:ABC-type oligopeptide transport system substrate-binding subunit